MKLLLSTLWHLKRGRCFFQPHCHSGATSQYIMKSIWVSNEFVSPSLWILDRKRFPYISSCIFFISMHLGLIYSIIHQYFNVFFFFLRSLMLMLCAHCTLPLFILQSMVNKNTHCGCTRFFKNERRNVCYCLRLSHKAVHFASDWVIIYNIVH